MTEMIDLLAGIEYDGAVKVHSDAMAPLINKGDHVLVKEQQPERDGQIVVAVVADQGTCRRYRRDGDTVHLLADNETVERITAPAADVKVMGVVVGLVRSLA